MNPAILTGVDRTWLCGARQCSNGYNRKGEQLLGAAGIPGWATNGIMLLPKPMSALLLKLTITRQVCERSMVSLCGDNLICTGRAMLASSAID
jgi:hypothetical protein